MCQNPKISFQGNRLVNLSSCCPILSHIYYLNCFRSAQVSGSGTLINDSYLRKPVTRYAPFFTQLLIFKKKGTPRCRVPLACLTRLASPTSSVDRFHTSEGFHGWRKTPVTPRPPLDAVWWHRPTVSVQPYSTSKGNEILSEEWWNSLIITGNRCWSCEWQIWRTTSPVLGFMWHWPRYELF